MGVRDLKRPMGVRDLQRFEAHKVLAHDHEMADLERRNATYKRQESRALVMSEKTDITEICVGPDFFDFFDDLLLFSIFRETAVFHEKGYKYGKAEHVEVKILSTLMTRENCAFAEEDSDHIVEKKLKESVFVGQVSKALEECPVPAGTLVTSLRRSPVQAKLVTVPIDALIPIPEKMDSGEAAAVVSTFTPAMGMLFHGRTDRESRFLNSSLKGLDILVTGGGTDDADAIVNLALLSGANRVFVLQSKLSLATWHAQSVHVELVSDNPEEWTPIIDRYMDLIMDLEYPKNFEALYGILKNTGRLVCRKPSPAFSGFLAPVEEFRFELALWSYPNASIYDLDEQIEDEHAEMVRDVRYLFRLLQKRKIRPKIDQYVKVRDIEIIREHMRANPGSGAVICEPWRQSI